MILPRKLQIYSLPFAIVECRNKNYKYICVFLTCNPPSCMVYFVKKLKEHGKHNELCKHNEPS